MGYVLKWGETVRESLYGKKEVLALGNPGM